MTKKITPPVTRTDRAELNEYLAKLPPEELGKHTLRAELRGMHPFCVPGYLMLHLLVRDPYDPADVGRANAIVVVVYALVGGYAAWGAAKLVAELIRAAGEFIGLL